MEIKSLLNQFCEYSSFIRGYSPYTIERYRSSVNMYTKFCGITQIDEVTELNLKYTDIDIENRSVFVRLGKGSKDRIVPICDRLADILGKYLVERQKVGKTCPELFTALNTNTGFTADGLRRMMITLTKVLGKNFGVHKLRHTFATQMIEGGCDIFSLSKMMGHSDIKTTTIYLAASSEHLRAQIGKHPLNQI